MKTAIDFGMYLTGNDRDTIEQMFNDWNSCNVASQPMSAEQYSSGAIHSLGEFPAPAMSAKQGLCRWIKASERLPGIGKVVLVKYFDIYQELYYKNKVWFVKGTNLVAYSECFSLQLEWLETLSTAPTVKAEGWVSVEEKQRLESIIELKEKERQEWANMCIRNKKILDGLISGYCTVNEYMYNEYGKLILKEISETFLKNATKADRISDTEVFQALGETILNFPLPSPPNK